MGTNQISLSDLVASYLFEKNKANFRLKIYHGIYKDEGLAVFKGKKKSRNIKDWLKEFQKTVNTAVGNQHLQFTAEIWTNEANSSTPAKEDRFQIVMNDEFPFLDVKMSLSLKGDLQFRMFRGK